MSHVFVAVTHRQPTDLVPCCRASSRTPIVTRRRTENVRSCSLIEPVPYRRRSIVPCHHGIVAEGRSRRQRTLGFPFLHSLCRQRFGIFTLRHLP